MKKGKIKINKIKEYTMKAMRNTRKVKTTGLLALIIVSFALFFFLGNNNAYSEKEVSNYNSLKEGNTKITFTGDVSPSRYLKETSKEYGHSVFYDNVKGIWEDSDVTLINLEASVLKDDVSEYHKADKAVEIFLDLNKDDVVGIKESGINLIGYANNHSMDYRVDGMIESLEIFDELSIDYVGAGHNYVEAVEPHSIEKDGQKTSIMAITDVTPNGFGAQQNIPGANSTRRLERDFQIEKMVNSSDVSIVYIHWGTEYAIKPDKEIQELGRHFIDLGVDLVVGSHPHVLLPIEEYKDGMIVYSLGNLVFDQAIGRTTDSAIANLYLDGNEKKLEFVPINIKSGIPYETQNKRKINRVIKTLSKELDEGSYKIEDNKLILNF